MVRCVRGPTIKEPSVFSDSQVGISSDRPRSSDEGYPIPEAGEVRNERMKTVSNNEAICMRRIRHDFPSPSAVKSVLGSTAFADLNFLGVVLGIFAEIFQQSRINQDNTKAGCNVDTYEP